VADWWFAVTDRWFAVTNWCSGDTDADRSTNAGSSDSRLLPRLWVHKVNLGDDRHVVRMLCGRVCEEIHICWTFLGVAPWRADSSYLLAPSGAFQCGEWRRRSQDRPKGWHTNALELEVHRPSHCVLRHIRHAVVGKLVKEEQVAVTNFSDQDSFGELFDACVDLGYAQVIGLRGHCSTIAAVSLIRGPIPTAIAEHLGSVSDNGQGSQLSGT